MDQSGLRVLMTGGAGYVGSACFRFFRQKEIEVFVFDDLSEGNRQSVSADRLYIGDIANTDILIRLIRELKINAILHFAALSSVPHSFHNPQGYWSVNFNGTKSVLMAMAQTGIGKLVLSSTAAVYDHKATRPITEDDPVAPETPYGSSKLAAELLTRDLAKNNGFSAVALRYFNACGAERDGTHGEARRDETHVVPILMDVALGKRPVFNVFGDRFNTPDGTCIRDFVSIQDLADAHLRALMAPARNQFLVCNVGSGTGTSVMALLQAARRVTGRAIPHKVVNSRAGDPPFLVASIVKAQQILGWRPKSSDIGSILGSAWRWHSGNPNGYGNW